MKTPLKAKKASFARKDEPVDDLWFYSSLSSISVILSQQLLDDSERLWAVEPVMGKKEFHPQLDSNPNH